MSSSFCVWIILCKNPCLTGKDLVENWKCGEPRSPQWL